MQQVRDNFFVHIWGNGERLLLAVHSIDGLTQVDYAKQRPTVLVGAVCDYLESLFLSISIFLPFSPPLLLETRKSAETLPNRTVKRQHTLLETGDLEKMPWNIWHWSVSDIDHRQTGACRTCSRCGTFLFAPILVIVLWSQISGKDSPTHATSNSRSPVPHLCTPFVPHPLRLLCFCSIMCIFITILCLPWRLILIYCFCYGSCWRRCRNNFS